ncbi:hypothetical protein C8F01DRAFT_1157652 [Mycena amicta]|nr:hypothetical protein C8F01DRAFT_1157652 [Mycena amicta]
MHGVLLLQMVIGIGRYIDWRELRPILPYYPNHRHSASDPTTTVDRISSYGASLSSAKSVSKEPLACSTFGIRITVFASMSLPSSTFRSSPPSLRLRDLRRERRETHTSRDSMDNGRRHGLHRHQRPRAQLQYSVWRTVDPPHLNPWAKAQ